MSVPKNFRTFDLSVSFYKECKEVQLHHTMKNQLMRAAGSISLNLAEGAAKPSRKDKLRYYSIAYGSIKEIQAIIVLESLQQLNATADHLAASLYKLSRQ